MIKYILLLLFCLICNVHCDKPRVWERIPQYFVDHRVSSFLNQNRITNCFEYVESPTNLLLKCWRDNKLTDVSIEINPSNKRQRYIPISISI